MNYTYSRSIYIRLNPSLHVYLLYLFHWRPRQSHEIRNISLIVIPVSLHVETHVMSVNIICRFGIPNIIITRELNAFPRQSFFFANKLIFSPRD